MSLDRDCCLHVTFNTDFSDASQYYKTMTANGNAVVSSDQSKFGGKSGKFPNSSYTRVMASGENVLGSYDFTIKCWYYPIAKTNSYPTIISSKGSWAAGCWALIDRHASYSTVISFTVYNYGGTYVPLVGTTAINNGNWYHIAVTRSGNNFRLFVNGNLEATTVWSGSIDASTSSLLDIGGLGSTSGNYLNGYVDDLSIVRFTAEYTASFTAPTSAATVPTPLVVTHHNLNSLLYNQNIYTPSGYGGNGHITDVLTVNGVAARRKILLCEQGSMRLLNSVWSDDNGNFSFTNLPTGIKFVLIGIDYNNQYQPDILMNVEAST